MAALADADAWRARSGYPELRFGGGPVFGVAREREEGGWQLHAFFGASAPQDARDSMGHHFRTLAADAGRRGDQAAASECQAAGERLDWEAVDEMTVQGVRFRVVRADQFVRTGQGGPEPPRPTDPDPGEPGEAMHAADPTAGFVIDPVTATGMAQGILRLELLECVRKEGTVPHDVRADSRRALRSHRGGVLLPAAFTVAELTGGRWTPITISACPTPQGARDLLAGYLRVTFPWELRLSPADRAVYAAAADRLDARRCDELAVRGRRFRVVRVERLVRIGPDGPEGPRPSDPDPQPPVMVHTEQLREQGRLTDDDAPIEPDDDAKRFLQLFHEEEERRKSRKKRPR